MQQAMFSNFIFGALRVKTHLSFIDFSQKETFHDHDDASNLEAMPVTFVNGQV